MRIASYEREDSAAQHTARRSWLHLSSFILHPFSFVAQLVNRLEQLLRRYLGWIVTNVQQVFLQIDANLLDAWKP
jgi:hypothetical protein